jgi:4-hydroxythreonine-4-phosphate dehydrogenase
MKIVFSIGDINGIGIEVMLKGILQYYNQNMNNCCEIAIVCKKDIILDYSNRIGFKCEIVEDNLKIGNYYCEIIHFDSENNIDFGTINSESGIIAIDSLEIATDLVMNNKYNALITLPITKKSMYLANWKFPGHTEYLGFKTNAKEMMILTSENIRVALATIHIPLSKVSESLNKDLIVEKINTFNYSLKNDFGIVIPRIAVLGLNPHSGENGSIGNEEIDIINPAIEFVKLSGIKAQGSFAADGFFAHKNYLNFDGILAMFHDQGLIPLKLLANGGGVNVTSGLPIIRTSPDHGSALEIAGKNIANPQSIVDSINMAVKIFENRQKANKY